MLRRDFENLLPSGRKKVVLLRLHDTSRFNQTVFSR